MANRKRLAFIRQSIAAGVLSISIIILGNFLGWPSPVLREMKKTGNPVNLTSMEISWMVSCVYLGNMVSPFPVGFLMDEVGRKACLLMLNIVALSSWTITMFSRSAVGLCVARFLAGLWGGIVMTVAPMYLAEIAEPKLRGALSTLVQMNVTIGILLSYIVGPYVSYDYLSFICGLVPVIFLLLMWNMPESPYWHIMKGNEHGAALSLAWLRGEKEIMEDSVIEEFNELSFGVHEEMRRSSIMFVSLWKRKGHRKALLIVEVLAAAQRLSGISAMLAYTSITLPTDGAGLLTVDQCVITMGLVWLVSTFFTTIFMDRWGRRPFLILSSLGSAVGTFITGMWFFLHEKYNTDLSGWYWVPFAGFIVYGFFFSIGLGPIPSTVQGELFSSKVKAMASAITSLVLAISSFFINITYILIHEKVGMFLNYWLFTVYSLLVFIFILFFVIETKGKTLHQIHQELER